MNKPVFTWSYRNGVTVHPDWRRWPAWMQAIRNAIIANRWQGEWPKWYIQYTTP